MAEPLKKALFLDRDGTINIDPGYISRPELLELLPGAAAAIRKARDQGYLIAVVSNQSGVGRGLIAPEMLGKIHERLNELLQMQAGARIDYFACCTHRPEDECHCRKPLPRLVYEAQAHLGIDLARSALIGDRLTDIRTGKSAPVGLTVLVRTGDGKEEEGRIAEADQPNPDHVADDLGAAIAWVLKNLNK
ncbi:MAG TPA: HAD-IIIA family hydrolase [Bdellovibrionota bacterium]|jgi:histidinol-phosphate phosphatase family protein